MARDERKHAPRSLDQSSVGRFVQPLTVLLVSNLSLDSESGRRRSGESRPVRARVAEGRRDVATRDRILGHLAIGIVSWTGVFVFSSYTTLGEFVAVMLLFAFGATSLIDAVWVGSHRAWGSGGPPTPRSWIDRIVVAVARRRNAPTPKTHNDPPVVICM